MKLPSLWPVGFFAGGILLSGRLADRYHLSLWTSCLIITALFLLSGYVLLRRRWILTAAAFGAAAWLCLGYSAASLNRLSGSPNLASALIETGRLDSGAALRWRGRLGSDPLELPWGTRYEINLDEVESSAGVTPVTGGLQLTYYRDESSEREEPDARGVNSERFSSPLARAGDRAEALAHALPVRNFGDPGSFDYRGYSCASRHPVASDIAQRPASDDRRLSAFDNFRSSRTCSWATPSIRSTICYASRPDVAALARAALLGDRTFVDRDRVLAYQKTGVYHVACPRGASRWCAYCVFHLGRATSSAPRDCFRERFLH